MKFKISTFLLASLFVSNMVFADSHNKPASSKSIVVKQELEVIGIDHDARWVLLKDRSGFTRKIEVGNEVQNFNQVSLGDIIKVNYAETIKIKAFGADAVKAGAEAEAVFGRAPKGQMPAMLGAKATTLVVTIANIDLENSLVTLKDKQGNTKTFRPRIIANLKKVKVGDKVAISFAKALVIKVQAGDK